ncbi:MAG: DUF4337 domain-containing protein [Armatimonadota bacterium]
MEPTELIEQAREAGGSKMGSIVALSVAVLAVFMGLFKVKDDNICQAMQQAQADRIDNWGWYQAKKTRLEVADSTVSSLKAVPQTPERDAEIMKWEGVVAKQKTESDDTKKKAEDAEKTYNKLNYRDDQFDMADSGLAIAIAVLAVTALTQNRKLLIMGFVFAGFGLILGLAGMFGWSIHPDFLANFLGT